MAITALTRRHLANALIAVIALTPFVSHAQVDSQKACPPRSAKAQAGFEQLLSVQTDTELSDLYVQELTETLEK